MKTQIKLIALDLDGTLLNNAKEISPADYRALARAAECGIHIVPATGRFYRGMPESIKTLPFVRYVICMNGAQVCDAISGKALFDAQMSWSEAQAVFDYFESLPVIYDCFQDGWGWMDKQCYELIDEFAPSAHNAEMLRELRTPLDGFRDEMRRRRKPIQKAQAFFKDMALRERQLIEMAERFPKLNITSAISNNIEVNSRKATKGAALEFLCGYLHIPSAYSMAFGDDLNDISMFATAGVGVAMGNSPSEVKEHADVVTKSNDDGGIAQAIEQLVFSDFD